MEEKGDERNSMKSVKKELQNAKEEEEEVEVLKKRISSHPLYGLLLEEHLNCLKVCSGDDPPEIETEEAITLLDKATPRPDSSPHLDLFMEAYCAALRELKEAMEKPLQETDRFVGSMYSQLNDIVRSSPHP
ncbi:PREDICTED: protein KNATM-like [Tarenaya hassleriana]|uniref:protein KNATM-like n=1 Tax=Tarenaya hassleriana TaxID=28532 RepID=UPI00053C9517|nr:PREDICTED: protein KNATM-like [Tarenaya hassleriana]